jgi:hypothetical protein
VCVWQGDAVAEMGITAGTGPTHPFTLHTGIDPKHADGLGMRVTLLDVTPVPRNGVSIKAEDYRVRLRVEALPAG